MKEAAVPAAVCRWDPVSLAVAGLGAAAVVTQLTLLRELLGAFSGNELVLGLGLGLWLLLTAGGTQLGGRVRRSAAPEGWFVAGLVATAWLPLVQLLALRGGRDGFLPRGAAAGLGATIVGCAVTLLPFCLVAGALLSAGCVLLERAGRPDAIGRIYFADTAGSLAGGAAFTFLLVGRLEHVALLGVAAAWLHGLAGVLAWRRPGRRTLAGVMASAATLGVSLAAGGLEARSAQWRHRAEIVHRATSPYGCLVVTREAGQLTFFENGVPIAHTDNRAEAEEAAHYALAQRPAARRVLLISGGVAGVAREVLRHRVESVTCVELDPAIVAAGKRLRPDSSADPRLELVLADGRWFLRHTGRRFDVIIVDLPDPVTLQISRFYTREFLAQAKRALVPGGVVAFGLARYQNYVSEDLGRVLATGHATVRSVFREVELIPGGRVFFLGSDAPLHLDIAERLEAAGVAPQLVNRHYLGATLAPDRLADLRRAVAAPAVPNADFAPVLFHHSLRHWLGQFAAPPPVLLGCGLGALGVYLVRLRTIPRVILAAGFAATGLELVLLLAFQVLYGSLYQQVGLVVTVFMAGLAAGAAGAMRGRPAPVPGRAIARLGAGIAVLAGALPWLLPAFGGLDSWLGTELAGQTGILAVTFLLAGLVGAQFPLAGAAGGGDAGVGAARLFSADLVGASLGALLVSAWMIPVLGVAPVCLITAGLNGAAAAVAWSRGEAA